MPRTQVSMPVYEPTMAYDNSASVMAKFTESLMDENSSANECTSNIKYLNLVYHFDAIESNIKDYSCPLP